MDRAGAQVGARWNCLSRGMPPPAASTSHPRTHGPTHLLDGNLVKGVHAVLDAVGDHAGLVRLDADLQSAAGRGPRLAHRRRAHSTRVGGKNQHKQQQRFACRQEIPGRRREAAGSPARARAAGSVCR